MVYDSVFKLILKEIDLNGKEFINEKSEKTKGLELAHVIPILNRQDPFLTWQPYETLGRKIYFEYFNGF